MSSSPSPPQLQQTHSMEEAAAHNSPHRSPYDHPRPSRAYREAAVALQSSSRSSLRAFATASRSGTPINPLSAAINSRSPSQRGSLREELASCDDALCMPLPPAAGENSHQRSTSLSRAVTRAQGHYLLPRPSPTRTSTHPTGPSPGAAATAAAAAAAHWQVQRRINNSTALAKVNRTCPSTNISTHLLKCSLAQFPHPCAELTVFLARCQPVATSVEPYPRLVHRAASTNITPCECLVLSHAMEPRILYRAMHIFCCSG